MTAPDWTERIEAAACGPFNRVEVVDETPSTQDTARRLDAGPGTIVVARRQTAGRGRQDPPGRSSDDPLQEL